MMTLAKLPGRAYVFTCRIKYHHATTDVENELPWSGLGFVEDTVQRTWAEKKLGTNKRTTALPGATRSRGFGRRPVEEQGAMSVRSEREREEGSVDESGHRGRPERFGRAGFTLLELRWPLRSGGHDAVVVLAFDRWFKLAAAGTSLRWTADHDEQLVSGLRSAYYPTRGAERVVRFQSRRRRRKGA
jgi:hypothetical protein